MSAVIEFPRRIADNARAIVVESRNHTALIQAQFSRRFGDRPTRKPDNSPPPKSAA